MTVRNAAPTRSPVVMGLSRGVSSSFSPAFGLLELLPPVLAVTGGLVLPNCDMLARITSLALTCCSMPDVPSDSCVDHLMPQEFPVPHVFPTAAADFSSSGRIFLAVSGTIMATSDSQVDVTPLKRISLRLQLSIGSHDASLRMPSSTKFLSMTPRSPSTTSFHLSASEPDVYRYLS